jgi:hypothetical protein
MTTVAGGCWTNHDFNLLRVNDLLNSQEVPLSLQTWKELFAKSMAMVIDFFMYGLLEFRFGHHKF